MKKHRQPSRRVAPQSHAAPKSSRVSWIALGVLLLVAALPRLYRIDHGLPGMVYVDSVKFVDEAARMVATADTRPAEYQYPGLFTNLLALLYATFGVHSVYWQQLTGQIISALSGVALAGVAYLLALFITGQAGAVTASLLTSVCVAAVTESRIPAPDSAMALLMCAALLLLLRQDLSVKKYVLAGSVCGLSVGMKWTGLYLLAWIPIGLWVIDRETRLREWARLSGIACVSAFASLIITSPWLALTPGRYLARLGLEMEIQGYGQVGRVQAGYLDYWMSATPTWEQPWLGTSFLANHGITLMLVLLAAVVLAAAGRGGRRAAFLAVYVIGYVWAVSGPGHLKAFRFLLPVLPIAFALTGWLIDSVAASRLGRWRTACATAAAAAVCAFPAWRTYDYLGHMLQPTTNDLALEWARHNIPSGSRVLASPFFTGNLRELPLRISYLPGAASRQYRIPGDRAYNGEIDPLYRSDLLELARTERIRYIVLNSYFNDAFSPVGENLRYFPRSVAGYRDFLSALQTEARLIFSVKGWSDGRLGPDIEIYSLD